MKILGHVSKRRARIRAFTKIVNCDGNLLIDLNAIKVIDIKKME
jgi:hypothetical protein